MKVWFVRIMMVVILLTGCAGKKLPEEPKDSIVESDIESYITTFIDEEADIEKININEGVINHENQEWMVTGQASYSDSNNKYTDFFTLVYGVNQKEWELEKCLVDKAQHTEMPIDAVTVDTKEEQKESYESKENVVEDEPKSHSYSQEELMELASQLPEDWREFAFILDGVMYKLPMRYQEFLDHGWQITRRSAAIVGIEPDQPVDVQELIPANSTAGCSIRKGNIRILIDVYNLSQDSKLFSECMVGEIMLSAGEGYDFMLSKGISGSSNREDVENQYGIADSSTISGLRYKANENSVYESVSFNFDSEDKLDYVSLTNYVYTEENEQEEIQDVCPDYLGQYIAPSEFGFENKEAIVELDGVLYQFPCPYSEFVNHGWRMASGDMEDQIVASLNKTGPISLEKDGQKISVMIFNFSDKRAYMKNCAVSKIYFKAENNPSLFRFTKNLDLGSTKEELAQLDIWNSITEDCLRYEIGSRGVFSNMDSDKEIAVCFDEDGNILNGSIGSLIWDYE